MSAALAYPVNDARPPRAANDNALIFLACTDSLGNIREKKLGSRTVRFTYDSRNRLTQSLDGLVTLSPLTLVSPNQRFTPSQLRLRYSILLGLCV